MSWGRDGVTCSVLGSTLRVGENRLKRYKSVTWEGRDLSLPGPATGGGNRSLLQKSGTRTEVQYVCVFIPEMCVCLRCVV